MRTVFSNRQVCHVWASQSQGHGRSGSIFFDGDTIYSYGRHYAMARIYSKAPCEQLALVNNYVYSNSTAKHLRDTYNALQGRMPSLAVPNPSDLKASENEDYLLDQIASTLDLSFNNLCQYRQGLEMSLFEQIKDLNTLRKFRDGKRFKEFDLDTETWNVVKEIQRSKHAKHSERELIKSERRERELKAERIEYQGNIEAWPAHGETKSIPYRLMPTDFDRVRVSKDGTEIETMRGATVPISHARRLLMLVLNGAVRVGERVGHFTVDETDARFLKIGCHRISIEQAKQVLLNNLTESKGA